MKLRVRNIRINRQEFTEAKVMQMYVPADSEQQEMYNWLAEYENKPYTTENALKTYIRTAIFFGYYILDYDVDLIKGHDIATAAEIQPYNADLFDHNYKLFKSVTFKLQVPKEIVVDLDYLALDKYDEDIKQITYELLLDHLPLSITDIQ